MIELKNGVLFDPENQSFINGNKVIKCCENTKAIENFSIVTTSKIMSIVLFITNACNLKCPYCYEWKKLPQKIELRYIKKAIELFNESLLGFSFFGGEPFLEFDYLKSIYEYIKGENPKAFISINTNGTLLDDEKLDWIKNSDVSIVISWDGYDDAKRYNGSTYLAKEVLNNAIRLKKDGVPCSVRFTVTDITYENLKKSVDILVQNGIKYVIEPAVDVSNNKIDCKTVEVINRFYSSSSKYIRNLPDYERIHEQLSKGLYRYYGCGAGRRVLRMDTDGNLYDCHRQMPNKNNLLANIMDVNDGSGIKNERFFQGKVNLRVECSNCDYKYICGGGCFYSHSNEYCSIYKNKINAILNELYDEYYRR